MPWTVSLKSTNPATLNSVNQSAVDVPLMATHTDGRTKSKIVSRTSWTTDAVKFLAQEYLAELLAVDVAAAASNTTLPTINAYIATNPALATG